MKHRVAELDGALLDAAVAIAEDKRLCKSLYNKRLILGFSVDAEIDIPSYSTGWAYAGPIIERERIQLEPPVDNVAIGYGGPLWSAYAFNCEPPFPMRRGPTALVVAMRAYVASKYGETVELP
jgi:hypothetical protein